MAFECNSGSNNDSEEKLILISSLSEKDIRAILQEFDKDDYESEDNEQLQLAIQIMYAS